MLKETFKMRKIGKHLVNVSMLSLAIAPVVVSGVQPVFAEERVANAETAYPTKIENDMMPSNTPDAKGTYNSQIKSIELVNVSGNAYRYKVTLHDGYTIPDGGILRFDTNIASDALSLDSSNVLNSAGSVIGGLNTVRMRSEASIDTELKFNDIQTASEYSSLWKSLTSKDYAVFDAIEFTSKDLFSKMNANRSFEFVINVRPYYEYGSGSNGYKPLSYVDKPASFDLLFPGHTFGTGVGLGDKYVKSGEVRTFLTTKKITTIGSKPFTYDIYGDQLVRSSIDSDANKPQWIESYFGLRNGFIYTLSSHSGQNVQEGSNKALYLKKGDIIRYKIPDVLSLKYKKGVSVGDSLSLIVKETTPSSYVEKKNRFSDTTDYKVFERVRESAKESSVSFKLTKLEDSLIEGVVEQDVYINPKTEVGVYLPFTDNKALSGIVDKVGLNRSITSVLTTDDLKTFTESSDPEFSKRYNDTGVSVVRDGSVLGKSNNMSLFFRKNRNVAVGDQTNGTVKVKYVDESGAEIPNNPIETIAENKPWYEQVTITPKEIAGYKFVKADKDLKLAVGTGENIVTLTYSRNVTYIPDPKYNAGEKVPDPDDPSRIHVGTKPKVVEEDIPFKEEVRENPKLPKGTENVIQEGEKGKKTTTTTYTVDPKTGDVTPSEKVTTKDPKNRIIERGTGEDKDGDLIVNYIPDPENEPGKQTIVDEGKKPKLDVTGKVKDPGKPKVIKVGTKPKVVEEEIPFKEEVRENPKLPKGTENVIQEGEKGKKTTTTTYTLDEKTGKVTSSEKVTTKEPKNRIIERGTGEDKDGDLIVNYIPDPENEPGKQTIVDEGKKPKRDVTGKVKDPGKPKVIKVGTKPKVVEEDIPFKEEVRENPKLPKGTEFVIQEGEKGKKKTTTTYTLDPKTGKVTSEDKVETKDPKNRIIERGTGEDVDGEIVVTYIPDPENDPGKQTVVDEGSKPKLDVTGKVKDPGKPKVIKVGTKPKVVEEEIPFKEEVRENPKLPKGTENVIQEGEKGKKTTTTTYTMDPKTGEVKPTEKVTTKDPKTRIVERGNGENKDGDLIVKYIPDPEEEPGKQTVVDEGKKPKFDVTGKEIDPGSPKVIKVGTKPKVVEEEVPFKEEVRENPELPEGERKVVQEGHAGKKTTTTTYTLDEKTGKVKESTTEKVDEPKVQIVEVGTKKSEVPKEEPKVETPKTTEVPKKEEPKVEQPKTTEIPKTEPKTTEEPKAKETPKQLPKTSEQAKQRNTAIIALLSVVGLGGLATYLGLRKRDEK